VKYLIDACAFITFLDEDEGADKVVEIIRKANSGEAEVYISCIQLLEIYYDRGRAKDWDYTESVFKSLTNSSVKIIYIFSPEELRYAGRLKVAYSISLADSIACAVAKELSATLITSDHSELEPIEQHEKISFLWLPPKPRKQQPVDSEQLTKNSEHG
jgi:predicted nucleic acid-binding protein